MKKSIIFLFLAILLVGGCSGNSTKISGYATESTYEINTEFAIDAWGFMNWGECTDQQGTWANVDSYCKQKGYTSALPAGQSPCFHAYSLNRWGWNGNSPMAKGSFTGSGYALTKVRCITSSALQCSPSCPTGYTCESDKVCRKDGKTCTETGDTGINYDIQGSVIDTQTSWMGNQWTDTCEGSTLVEFYCSSDNVALTKYACPYGCENGVCKTAPVTQPQCTPSPCPSGYTCESDNVCRKGGQTCTETGDSGKDYNIKGTVVDTQTSWTGYQWTDTCEGSTVVEFYCSSDNVALTKYACQYGCANGICNIASTGGPVESACTDPDDPNNDEHPYRYRTKSTVTSTASGSKTDYCTSPTYIREYSCDPTTKAIKSEDYDCANEGYQGICTDGACYVPLDTDEETSSVPEEPSTPIDIEEPDDLDPDAITEAPEEEEGTINICIDSDGPYGYYTKNTASSPSSGARTDQCAVEFAGECPGCVWDQSGWHCAKSVNTAVFSKYDCRTAEKGEYLVEYSCDYSTKEVKSSIYDCGFEGKTCKAGACVGQQICTPGQKLCEGNNLKTCDQSGAAWSTEACANGCENNACKSEEVIWYDVVCTGTPKPCRSYDKSECNSHPGCSMWNFWLFSFCLGTPKPCSTYTGESVCTAQGCAWG